MFFINSLFPRRQTQVSLRSSFQGHSSIPDHYKTAADCLGPHHFVDDSDEAVARLVPIIVVVLQVET